MLRGDFWHLGGGAKGSPKHERADSRTPSPLLALQLLCSHRHLWHPGGGANFRFFSIHFFLSTLPFATGHLQTPYGDLCRQPLSSHSDSSSCASLILSLFPPAAYAGAARWVVVLDAQKNVSLHRSCGPALFCWLWSLFSGSRSFAFKFCASASYKESCRMVSKNNSFVHIPCPPALRCR